MASRDNLKTLIDTNLGTSSGIVTKVKHKTIEDAIVDSCKPYIIGYFTVANIGTSTSVTSISGVSSVVATQTANVSKFVITFFNALASTNYYVRTFIKGLSSDVATNDTTLASPLFSNTLTSRFDLYIRETGVTTQNVTVYFEVIPLD